MACVANRFCHPVTSADAAPRRTGFPLHWQRPRLSGLELRLAARNVHTRSCTRALFLRRPLHVRFRRYRGDLNSFSTRVFLGEIIAPNR